MPRMPRLRIAGAFTLIEILIVIAIVGILVSLLLPALRRARLAAQQSISMSNVRSIAQAGAGYQNDHSALPIVPNGVPVPTPINGWVPFTSWGKYTSTWWTQDSGRFDIPPARRPLNPYLYSGELPDLPDALADPAVRKNFQLAVCKDPSDRIGHQQNWNAFQSTFGQPVENSDRSTCYDDVGTSYLWQSKWFFQTARGVGDDWTKAFSLGTRRMAMADTFIPARMIWVNDEYCDLTMNQVSDLARVVNGYGDVNKAVVGFLDGHVKYIKILPGGEGDPRRIDKPWLVPAFSNSEYTVVFPSLSK